MTAPQSLRRLRGAASVLALGASAVLLPGAHAQSQDASSSTDARTSQCQELFGMAIRNNGAPFDARADIRQLVQENDPEACYFRLTQLRDDQRRAEGEQAGQETRQASAASQQQAEAAPSQAQAQPRARAQSQASQAGQSQQPTQQTGSDQQQASGPASSPQAQPSAQDRQSTPQQAASATRTIERDIEVEETVTVAGQVDVEVGVPQVEVAQQAATVNVSGSAPSVSVTSEQPSIVVREQPTQIRVRVPQPEIIVEQQAPQIIVTMPDPTVDVSSAEPTVEVRQAEPQVRVSMADPTINLDLRAVSSDSEEAVNTRVTRQAAPQTASGGNTDADIRVTSAEPNVRMQGMDAEPRVTIDRPEPRISFESAEPQVDFQMAQPNVRFERMGEPQVTVRRSNDDPMPERMAPSGQASGQSPDQGSDQQQSASAASSQGSDQQANPSSLREEGQAASSSTRQAQAPQGREMRADELVGQKVLSTGGDEIGEIDRFVRQDGEILAILDHGGFFGLGEKQIAVPVDELRREGEQMVAANLTEDRVEAMEDQEISGTEIDGSERISVRIR